MPDDAASISTLASSSNLVLPFKPAQVERLRVRAIYLEGQLDPKAFRQRHTHYPVLAADPLIIEPVRGSFVALTKFGSVVLWNSSDKTEKGFLASRRARPLAQRHDGAVSACSWVSPRRRTFNGVAEGLSSTG
jgi:hypothetical protein